MSIIYLDVTRLVTRLYQGLLPTGVDRVGLQYIRHYGNRARAVLSERGFFAILSEKDSTLVFDWLTSSIGNKNAICRLVARAYLKSIFGASFQNGILLHTSHSGMEFPRYYKKLASLGIKSVFLIHDLIPLTHAEYTRPGVEHTHRRRIHTALGYASGLITNSRSTLESLTAEATHAALPLPPCVIAHLASGVEPQPPRQRLLEAPYFVMLGTIEPRKNHWFILHVWRRLIEQLGNAAPKLVVIGRRGWECENVIDMLERCASLPGTVIEEANCSDERLHAWLQHARALLFPSFVEGYGMPLVEALGLGVPVLASDLDVFREVAAEIPDYLDPLDGPGWAARIRNYARDDSRERTAQLARIKHFREPTWVDHFERVDAFLDTLN
ncbi:glycosyltransferase family 4 protein [Burkholderia thailandensis]|uniref:glycosyltransferase family 4 protein n=1 Tax=Burkholderia thailandensis TaxID=57975 RepID=UPI00016A46CA|nr:glycosyltransferase family 1 protein [Burkholderia thailandensis]AJT48626.1 capsular biosynthesis protein [Burkholderia thailandensis]AOI50983.1 capsular biosynthesis protein [Burkholderia thailandensis]MCS3389843.1 glycosyltransferase family 4 protein [Burkholderia thailandensis]MCS6424835.1 glycosyltransferase family 4 protein [Burkholderia thailandensis]MCS6452564.1 glycosyltransferase family 4 protein [Burkholderia thailandensis]